MGNIFITFNDPVFFLSSDHSIGTNAVLTYGVSPCSQSEMTYCL